MTDCGFGAGGSGFNGHFDAASCDFEACKNEKIL